VLGFEPEDQSHDDTTELDKDGEGESNPNNKNTDPNPYKL
jgi:hypothetical protein